MRNAPLILFCLFAFISGFIAVMGFRMIQVKNVLHSTATFNPSPIDFQLDPPRQSLTGKVIGIKGGAIKSVRNEKNTVIVETNTSILEGEQITASASGSLDVQFAQTDLISISPDTTVAFSSTNPKNFLVKQDKGTVFYQTDNQVPTISIRSLHALFSLSQGKAELAVDPDKKIIEFTLAQGQGKVSYIDSDNKTQTVEVTSGQVATFDDVKKTVVIK